MTDQQWLQEFFEYEVCTECGWDYDKHIVGPDPLGLRHAYCTDPIPENLSDEKYEAEIARRIRIST